VDWLVDENQTRLQWIQKTLVGANTTLYRLNSSGRSKVSRYDNLGNSSQVVEESAQHVVKLAFHSRLKLTLVLLIKLLRGQVQFNRLLLVVLKVHSDEVVESKASSEGYIQLNKVTHVHSIRLLK